MKERPPKRTMLRPQENDRFKKAYPNPETNPIKIGDDGIMRSLMTELPRNETKLT